MRSCRRMRALACSPAQGLLKGLRAADRESGGRPTRSPSRPRPRFNRDRVPFKISSAELQGILCRVNVARWSELQHLRVDGLAVLKVSLGQTFLPRPCSEVVFHRLSRGAHRYRTTSPRHAEGQPSTLVFEVCKAPALPKSAGDFSTPSSASGVRRFCCSVIGPSSSIEPDRLKVPRSLGLPMQAASRSSWLQNCRPACTRSASGPRRAEAERASRRRAAPAGRSRRCADRRIHEGGQVARCEAARCSRHMCRSPGRHDAATVLPSARSHVDDPIACQSRPQLRRRTVAFNGGGAACGEQAHRLRHLRWRDDHAPLPGNKHCSLHISTGDRRPRPGQRQQQSWNLWTSCNGLHSQPRSQRPTSWAPAQRANAMRASGYSCSATSFGWPGAFTPTPGPSSPCSFAWLG